MRSTFILLCLFITVICDAQEKKWTLQECMQYAVENSPRVHAKEAKTNIDTQNYIEAVGRLLPSVNAGSSIDYRFGRGLDAETNTYTSVNSFSNNYNLYSSMRLFDGMSSIATIRMHKVNRLMGREELQEVKDMLAYETMEAYFNVLFYKEMVKLAEQQLAASVDNLKQVRRMEELGMKGVPDVAEMQAKEATDNYKLTCQRNIQTLAIIKLKEKMNFPIDQDLDIADYISEEGINKYHESAMDIYQSSLTFLPKALATDASVEAQRLSYQSAKGSLLPSITAEAGISTNFSHYMDGTSYAKFNDQFRDKRGSYIGFTLSIPILNGFSNTARIQRSKSQLQIAKSERAETLRILYSEIEQAVADMNGQSDEYLQAKKQAEAMIIADNVNKRKYKEGLISAIDLHTSSNRLLESKIVELNARFKYYLKSKLVNYYKGESYISE